MALFCRACHRVYDSEQQTCPRDSCPLQEFEAGRIAGFTIADRYVMDSLTVPIGGFEAGIGKDQSSGHNVSIQAIDISRVKPDSVREQTDRLKGLDHDNLCKILDVIVDQSKCFVVSDLPGTTTISELIDRPGELDVTTCLHLASQICDALSYLHGNQMVHGQILPVNALVVQDSAVPQMVKLFNVSLPQPCLADGVVLKPTSIYRSPEIISGEAPSVASDIYSLGCMMYELLTGVPPFSAGDKEQLLTLHREAPPLPLRGTAPELDIPELIDQLVLRCLRKDRAGRYQSVDQLKAELLKACEDSRIYLPGARSSDYASQSYGQPQPEIAEAPPQPDLEEQVKGEDQEKEEELPPETREELETKIQGLRSHIYLLTGVAIAAIVAVFVVFGYEGSAEDKGPLWKKLYWQVEMSQGDGALSGGDTSGAKTHYEKAESLAGGIEDGGDRRFKALRGLLKVYEATDDTESAKKLRKEIVSLDRKRLESLFESDKQDSSQVKDISLSMDPSKMSPATAEEYSGQFIDKARKCIKKGHMNKAESYLNKALQVEEVAHTANFEKASHCCNDMAEHSTAGKHLASITRLLEKALELESKHSHDRRTARKVRTLMNLALAKARAGDFKRSEQLVEKARTEVEKMDSKDRPAMMDEALASYVKLLEQADKHELAEKHRKN